VLTGMILGAAAVVAALMCYQIGQSARGRNLRYVQLPAVGLAIAGAIAAIAIVTTFGEGSAGESRSLGGVRVDELARVSSSFSSPSPTRQMQAGKVASIASLISGLEQRLETESADAGGWSLLAQSYAFVGKTEQAEHAVLRAVELGADESDLRNRVSSARRDPHAGIPGAPPLD
jgi:cytochrome c-type biogenesis protein CcmH/NrfG